jgi:protein TonB
MTPMNTCLRTGVVLAAMAGILAGCSSPAPPAAPTTASAPPAAVAAPAPAPVRTYGPVGLVARDPALERYKRVAAERIHERNRALLFEGRPHHLLQAVIVVEVTVDRQGNVARSKIVRSPGIASLNNVALSSLKSASPLPAPPTTLVAKGPLVYSETWLFNNQSRFQLRTLALPQD